jgi:hypothetical protein
LATLGHMEACVIGERILLGFRKASKSAAVEE